MALRYNPFQPNKIIAPGMFVGRVEEIHAIEQCLFQTKFENPQHFLIEGERGIGKSSLLVFVDKFASGEVDAPRGGRFNFLSLGLDMSGVKSEGDIVRAIARRLRQEIGRRDHLKNAARGVWDFISKWEVAGVRYHSDQDFDVDEAREELIRNIVKLMDGAGRALDGVLLLVDEADAPPPEAGLGEFAKLFTERLEREGCAKLLLGLAGLPTTVGKLRASHDSSPRLFQILRLDPLEREERIVVIEKALEVAREKNGFETAITEDAAAMLADMSEGYPHFLQQFGHCAFEVDQDNRIDVTDVDRGATDVNGALDQLGKKYFNEMYYDKIGSHDYRKVLNIMAPYGDEWVSRQDIIKKSNLPTTTINNALRALRDREIILSDEARKGYYRLPTKSFAAWIGATAPEQH
jgi:hypothetical protein